MVVGTDLRHGDAVRNPVTITPFDLRECRSQGDLYTGMDMGV